MLSYLRGVLSLIFFAFNTLLWGPAFVCVALVRLVSPGSSIRRRCGRLLEKIGVSWMRMNLIYARKAIGIEWDIKVPAGLSRDRSYLVISNHCSWIDIISLEEVLLPVIPFPRFFVKQELIFIPILGFAWWALDYPFMKRYSPEFLAKHPELKGRDLEITRRKCAKFAKIPVAVMTFPEGTRFTEEKRAARKSPYTRLLIPKAGGAALVLSALESNLSGILNVTLVYPDGSSFWAFVCGKVRRIGIIVEKIPVTKDMVGDYMSDPKFQKKFRTWMNSLWDRKDLLIEKELIRYNKTKKIQTKKKDK